MLISHTKRFIFIHIYKTAGTSVMAVFLPYVRLIDRMAYEYPYSRKLFQTIIHHLGWHDDGMKQFTGFHKHAKAYEIKEKLGSTRFDSYYKFTFVRNPFDFLVSLYWYIAQAKTHRQHDIVSAMSFAEFLPWHIANTPARQLDFITEPLSDKRLVDYIGRFETLECDIITIHERLQLELRRSIPHKHRSLNRTSTDYKTYYNEECRNLVENYFQRDLTMLGYDFDSFSDKMPIMQEH